MLQELLSSGTLNLVYATIVVISFLFALLSLIGVGVGDALDFDFEIDSDSGFDLISISPFALATFGSTFGIVGLMTRLWLDMEAIPSVLWALGVGLLVGGLGQAFFLVVLSPSKSSHFTLKDDAVNREAEVVLTVPAEGLGTVTFNNVSGRVTLGARSMTGQPIRTGQLVIIEKMVGRIAIVRPLVDETSNASSSQADKV